MKNLSFLFLFAILLFNCNDDESSSLATNPPSQESKVFVPLEVGNTWIYEIAKIDSSGNEEILAQNDTINITEKVTIDNEVYYTLSDSNFGFAPITKQVKDSLGYIIDAKHRILFSSDRFGEVLYTELAGPAKIEFSMAENPQLIKVPFGEFDCLNYQGTVTHTDSNVEYEPRIINNYYSEDVGLVYSSGYYFSNLQYYYERRLISAEL